MTPEVSVSVSGFEHMWKPKKQVFINDITIYKWIMDDMLMFI